MRYEQAPSDKPSSFLLTLLFVVLVRTFLQPSGQLPFACELVKRLLELLESLRLLEPPALKASQARPRNLGDGQDRVRLVGAAGGPTNRPDLRRI